MAITINEQAPVLLESGEASLRRDAAWSCPRRSSTWTAWRRPRPAVLPATDYRQSRREAPLQREGNRDGFMDDATRIEFLHFCPPPPTFVDWSSPALSLTEDRVMRRQASSGEAACQRAINRKHAAEKNESASGVQVTASPAASVRRQYAPRFFWHAKVHP